MFSGIIHNINNTYLASRVTTFRRVPRPKFQETRCFRLFPRNVMLFMDARGIYDMYLNRFLDV